jgi:hypothetical protein
MVVGISTFIGNKMYYCYTRKQVVLLPHQEISLYAKDVHVLILNCRYPYYHIQLFKSLFYILLLFFLAYPQPLNIQYMYIVRKYNNLFPCVTVVHFISDKCDVRIDF